MPFMQRALIGGVLAALAAGYYSAFVVQRGLSFMGNGLAHAAFGGVALGLLLGAQPLWVALPFTVAAALGIVWAGDHSRLEADTSVGIFLALTMALGVIFLSMRRAASTDAMSYLFGSILHVGWGDVTAAGAVCAMTLALTPMWGRWAYATFDRELAASDGAPVRRDDYILAAALAVTVVVSVKLLGIVLVTAFLVIPAASARLLTPTFRAMTLMSMALGAASTAAGLGLSCALDLPSGATIILTQAALFFAALIFARGRG